MIAIGAKGVHPVVVSFPGKQVAPMPPILPPCLAALAVLVTCASPAPEFFGAARSDITLDGRAFTVFRDGNRVQVIRHGYAGMAERREIPARMLRAVEQATGCRALPESFVGDSGERRGRIAC